MKCYNYNLSEIDTLFIINALSYYLNEITWHDSLSQKEKISHYFNFEDDFERQYMLVKDLHIRLSLESNRRIYNIINDDFYIGQRQYLLNKKLDFVYNKNKYDKLITNYIKENRMINLNENNNCNLNLFKLLKVKLLKLK